jgi:hypothetical protein
LQPIEANGADVAGGGESLHARARSVAVTIARLAHSCFFLTTAVYSTICSVPFAYHQFIEPRLWIWPGRFVENFPYFYWLCLLVTLATFRIRAPLAVRIPQALYALAGVAVGVDVLRSPHLATIAATPNGLFYAAIALLFPVALAGIDTASVRTGHAPAADPPVSPRSVIRIALEGGCWVAAVYGGTALTASIASNQHHGVTFWVAAFTVSAVAHASLFAIAVAAPLMVTYALRRWRRLQRGAGVLMVTAALAMLLDHHVLQALTLTGPTAAVVAFLFAGSMVAVWTSLSIATRAQHTGGGPLASYHRTKVFALRLAPPFLLAMLAFLGSLVARADWDFTLQGLTVAGAWAGCCGLVQRAARTRVTVGSEPRRGGSNRMAGAYGVIGVAMFVLLALRVASAGSTSPGAQLALVRYSAADPSMRLLTRLLASEHTGETAAFYSFLRTNTNIARTPVTPLDLEYAASFASLRSARPHIFVLVVDSLRPDYLEPYNANVDFTPAIGAFARESLVFKRAFTRYGATAMAVPSIWSGGMTLHMQYVQPYWPMNTLEKLVTSAGYTQAISLDPITRRLLKPGTDVVRLDAGRPVAQYSACTTLDELQDRLSRGLPDPVFAFTLPQDVHISTSMHKTVPAGERYSGVVAPVASQVRQVDRCFGRFIEFLKRSGQYDNSIVVLTSDHGDSLGEDGRWGHAYTLYPEVVRIPLIMHIPAALRAESDTEKLAFSADIVPTLYDLLGVVPDYLGPLYGSSLVTHGAARDRSADHFLLASSYGPVYGMLTGNGRRYYIANAVTGQDLAYDLSDVSRPKMVAITPGMRSENWAAIQAEIATLRRLYRVGVPSVHTD